MAATHSAIFHGLGIGSKGVDTEIKKHVAVLFDIDDTLIDFDGSRVKVKWNGGDCVFWLNYLNALKKAGLEKSIQFHFGIATFKSPRGDDVSRAVLDDEHGIGSVLDKKLVYFTGAGEMSPGGHAKGKCKTEFALNIAKAEVKALNEDVWICDDVLEVCDTANASGYKSCYMSGLDSTESKMKNISKLSILDQQMLIHTLFESIFSVYGLLAALPQKPCPVINVKSSSVIGWAPSEAEMEGVKGLDEDEAAPEVVAKSFAFGATATDSV